MCVDSQGVLLWYNYTGSNRDNRGLSLSNIFKSQIYRTVISFRTGDYSPSTDRQPKATRKFPAQYGDGDNMGHGNSTWHFPSMERRSPKASTKD